MTIQRKPQKRPLHKTQPVVPVHTAPAEVTLPPEPPKLSWLQRLARWYANF